MAFDEAKARAYAFEPITVTVDRGRLAFFARATGQGDPVYTDLAAAQAAGHRDLPVPPTFFFGLELGLPEPFGYLAALGIDLRHVLHGKQSFTYHALAYAGETLTLRSRLTGVTVRSGGAMVLLVKTTDITRDGEPVAEASSTIVVRDPEAGPCIAITPVHGQPTCTGTVVSITDGLAKVKLAVTLADGTVTLAGDAIIDLN